MLFAGLCGALPAPQAPLGTGERKVLVFCFVVREIEGKATQVLLGRMQTPLGRAQPLQVCPHGPCVCRSGADGPFCASMAHSTQVRRDPLRIDSSSWVVAQSLCCWGWKEGRNKSLVSSLQGVPGCLVASHHPTVGSGGAQPT